MDYKDNPTLAPAIEKSDYEPKTSEADASVDADTVNDATAFLETFFKLYPTATEKELAYYVLGNVIEPIGRDYLYSELVNPIFIKDGDNVKVKVAVKFIDNQTKATQVSQYELAIVASLFMYIAFILISAVGTILAVQSLSDSTKYKYRYLTLRRLGINDKSLFKTIRKQLLILFCVPAISAILCSFVMMSSLNNVYQQILGDKHLYLIYFGLNLIIFFLIYSIYWIATYIGFKRNINEES